MFHIVTRLAGKPRASSSGLRCGAALLIILGLAADCALAQGTIMVMNTGSGQVLLSQMVSVGTSQSTAPLDLLFSFGFATAQTPQPGVLSDSFTVTLQSLNQQLTAVYVTIDASGLLLAPPSPGAVTLDPASIQAVPISYPSLQPVVTGNEWAYQVTALIPSQFATGPFNVYFDLFDNQNGIPSQGWYNAVGIVPVPEPSTIALSLAGGLLLWRTRAKRIFSGILGMLHLARQERAAGGPEQAKSSAAKTTARTWPDASRTG